MENSNVGLNKKLLIVSAVLVVALGGSWAYFINSSDSVPDVVPGERMLEDPAKMANPVGMPEGMKPMHGEQHKPTTTNPGGFSPSDMNVYFKVSEDGEKYTELTQIADAAAVPHLLIAQDGDLIATFQHFSDLEEENNRIGFSISDDGGENWTEAEMIEIEGLPVTTDMNPTVDLETMKVPVDPTLVQLEDGRFRLYFTYHELGEDYPGPASAIADEMGDPFVYEGKLFDNDETHILDPAVVYYEGVWHYFTTSHGLNPKDPNAESYIAYHATSEDGKVFEMQEKLDVGFNMLGSAIATEDGIFFMGSGGAGISEDGRSWENVNVMIGCSDPGVAQLEDGRFILACQNNESTAGKEPVAPPVDKKEKN